MEIKYFSDSDTLYIEFRRDETTESKDLDENTVLDVDRDGNVCAITFEHASTRTDVKRLTVEGIADKAGAAAADASVMWLGEPELVNRYRVS